MADDRPDTSDAQGAGDAPPEAKPAGYFEGESMTRRRAFTVAGQAVGGAAGAIIVLPAVGFSVAPMFDRPEEIWNAVGAEAQFGPETYRAKVVTFVPGIGPAGKTTVFVRRGDPTRFDESSDEFIAISTRCTHLGCPVSFAPNAGNFVCPCHGGVYDFEGRVIGGPPVRPLDRFQTRLRAAQVEVGPRFSVTSRLEPVRARDPANFTGGVWEYLYPPRPSTPPAP